MKLSREQHKYLKQQNKKNNGSESTDPLSFLCPQLQILFDETLLLPKNDEDSNSNNNNNITNNNTNNNGKRPRDSSTNPHYQLIQQCSILIGMHPGMLSETIISIRLLPICLSIYSILSYRLIDLHLIVDTDQATEPIVDIALSLNKPFAVIPCCVFPRLFSQRYYRGNLVVEYPEFIEYLRNKSKECISSQLLPFEGRNQVLYRLSPPV